MSVERLEVAASGLSFVMGTFPVLIVQKRKKRNKILRKRMKKRQKNELRKGERKANSREEKTQHN